MKEQIPTRKADTVAIVGFAPTTRSLAPYDKPNTEIEIWGCNEAYHHGFMLRWDRWFQIHSYSSFSRADNFNDPGHFQWLQEKHDFPIYMQQKYDDIPSSVRFPIALADKKFDAYFTSSFAYMMALAILMDFKKIETYGFEMSSETEYAYQRPNAEYMLGFARGKGIEVEVHSNWLLRGRKYAYEDDSIGYRQRLEFRKNSLAAEAEKEKSKFYESNGRISLAMELLQAGLLPKEIVRKEADSVAQIATRWNMIGAAQSENLYNLKLYDGHVGLEGGEFTNFKPMVTSQATSVESNVVENVITPEVKITEVKNA